MEVNDVKRKRKRSANTSSDQTEEYLKLMECDETFRTHTLNPSISPDYIETSWENLAKKLNCCDSGPVLSTKEWMKRFNDWKNNTRAKYRRIVENRMKTGGGEGDTIKLTPQEDRGLAAWGKVAVTGSSQVPVVGGLQLYLEAVPEKSSCLTPTPESDLVQATFLQSEIDKTLRVFEEENFPEPKNRVYPNEKNNEKEITEKRTCRRAAKNRPIKESRSVKMIGEELLLEYRNNNKNQEHLKLEDKKLELEVAKFKFEVAKYKFENPTFSFNIELPF